MPVFIQPYRFAAPFDPLTLSPAVWFDPSDAASVTLNGGNVSQINDKSGNARHAAQGTAGNQPPYVTAGMNGKNIIQFTATNHLLGTSSYTVTQPHTMVVVIKMNDLTGSPAVLYTQPDTEIATQPNWRIYAGTTATSSITADTSAHAMGFVVNGASSSIIMDGVTVQSGLSVGSNGQTTQLFIGRSGSRSAKADYGEIFDIPGVLSGASLTNLFAYLKAKWGTP